MTTTQSLPTAQTPDAAHARPRCLVIVPAFNESESIDRVVRGLVRELPHADVAVIDDGSTDQTARHVPPGALLISLPFNLGIGGAMQTGYRYAFMHGYATAVQVDADGQHPPDQARKLIDRLSESGADMVIGSRFLEESGYRQGPLRMMGQCVLSGLLRLLTGRRFTDCTSGFRACNRRVISAFAHWYPDDYPEPEVVLLLHRSGFRVEETAVTMQPRTTGQTSIPLHRGVFYVIKVSAALLLDMIRKPWPKGKVDLP